MSKKRKIEEGRGVFWAKWNEIYYFTQSNKKILCTICDQNAKKAQFKMPFWKKAFTFPEKCFGTAAQQILVIFWCV